MVKIPTILEAGRADGILIKTDNVYDDNQKKFLSDKLEEIDNNHNTLNNTIKSLSNTVNNNELDIETKLATEKTRAIEAETKIKTNLETKLETEKTRAISVENTLKENINTLTSTVNTNNSNINTKLQEEKTRATNAESSIDAKVEAERVRATNAESNLRETINNISSNQESLSNAENIKVKTLSNTSANNVQQALNELFKNATFCGIAAPNTNPGTPNSSVFYFANQEGTYINFNSIKVLKGETVILKWINGTWTKTTFNPITNFNSVFNTEGNNLNTVITNINNEVDILSEQQISYVSPCFANCSDSHEYKLQSISLAPNNIPSKRIFSITIKLADNLTLLNYSPVYMHLKDSVGNYIGVSQNAIKQVYNKGKYVTWFFDAAINSTNNPIIIKLHTTNSISDASDSNRIGIIAHVKQTNDVNGSGVTTFDGVYHQGWITAIGINVVNISAIYPQIKELQKYRMAYATSELPDISTTGHKANVKEIRINQNVMGISLVNSVSVMVASDNAYSGALYLKVHDINDDLVTSSNNSVNLSQNLGKYVTWYFTPFQLNTDAEYRFTAWNSSNVKQVMRIHVASGKNEGVTCLDQDDSPHTDYCPALGINISAIIANDLYKTIKEVNIALGNGIVTKAEKSYVDTQLVTKVDKVSGKGLSSNDFIDRYKFAIQPLADILEKKNETQNGVGDIVSNYCLGTLWEDESLLNVGAEIPLANHYTFKHKVDKIDGNNQEYIELSCNTYYVDYYTGGSNLKELFIRVPSDEHSYILLHCRQHGDGHGYRWVVKEKISRTDDVHDTTKIPYLFSPLRYTDDEVKKLQSTITALEARIAALESK